MRFFVPWLWCAIVIALPVLGGGPSKAESADGFYTGRQINLLVGFNAGGGYDIYGRILARHMVRHIAGKPTVIVKNIPGGGSLVAANHLYNVSPKDGSEVGLFAGSVATDPAIGGVPAKYDARKFVWIGSAYSDVATCFSWRAGPFKSAKDLFDRSMITGSVGNSATLIFPVAMNNVLGAKLNIVKGYQGSSGLKLALERGEIEGICGASLDSLQSSSPEWLRDRKITFLTQMTYQKTLQLPDVPLVTELAKTPEDRDVLNLVFSYMRMGRPLAAPPNVPQERVAILRQAFDATMRDAEFLAETKKAGLDIEPTTGREMDEFLMEIYQTPKPLIERAADVLKRTSN
jgi:tripartite-type tricarboxylate transporter receptor subunit TctC